MDQNYQASVDINKSFEEQELLEETKAIFANIFRDYWATPHQKEKIIAKEKYDRQIEEKEKGEKYDPNEIFKKVKKNNNLPIEIKKEKFHEKLIKFIKKIFSI